MAPVWLVICLSRWLRCGSYFLTRRLRLGWYYTNGAPEVQGRTSGTLQADRQTLRWVLGVPMFRCAWGRHRLWGSTFPLRLKRVCLCVRVFASELVSVSVWLHLCVCFCVGLSVCLCFRYSDTYTSGAPTLAVPVFSSLPAHHLIDNIMV